MSKLLEEGAQLSLIIQAVLILLSLGLIWHQLRQNAEIAKAANAQTLVGHAMSFTALLVQSPDLARLWHSHGPTVQDDPNEDRYRELLTQWLIFHENIYYQHTRGLLDNAVYKSWSTDLEMVLKQHDLAIVAADIKAFFPGDFGEHLVALRARLKPATAEKSTLFRTPGA